MRFRIGFSRGKCEEKKSQRLPANQFFSLTMSNANSKIHVFYFRMRAERSALATGTGNESKITHTFGKSVSKRLEVIAFSKSMGESLIAKFASKMCLR